MELTNIIKNGSIMESLENYALADNLASDSIEETLFRARRISLKKKFESSYIDKLPEVPRIFPNQQNDYIFHNDYQFWDKIIYAPDDYWNKTMKFPHFMFSDWIPRVPGLAFTDGARILSDRLHHSTPFDLARRMYRPAEKSIFVMSGVSSLKLSPDYDGYLLTCIVSSDSNYCGIPMLISPEVASYHRLKNGDVLESVKGVWQKMTTDWAKHFAVTDQLPRGYIMVNNPDQIQKSNYTSSFYYDPYSILEYEQDGILKWDYVFCNVSIAGRNQKKDIQEFFKDYQNIVGIHGQYLTNPDIGEPLFETTYQTPTDLRTDYARAQLCLIKERMNQTAVDGLKVDELTAKIARAYQDPYSLRVFAQKCGMNASLVTEDAPARMAVQIVHLAISSNLLLELVQRLLIEQSYL